MAAVFLRVFFVRSSRSASTVVERLPVKQNGHVNNSQANSVLSGQSYLISTVKVARNQTPQDLSASLAARISLSEHVFKNKPVVLDLNDIGSNGTPHVKALAVDQLSEFVQVCKLHSLEPIGVSATNADAKEAAKALGLSIMLSLSPQSRYLNGNSNVEREVSQQKQTKSSIPLQSPDHNLEKRDSRDTKIVYGSVRSGQQVITQGKSLVILGSVQSGAEVVSDGDIHIFGALRGRAIAGVSGDTKAKIIVQSFDAELVSIANVFTVCDSAETTPGVVRNSSTVVWLDGVNSLKFKSLEMSEEVFGKKI